MATTGSVIGANLRRIRKERGQTQIEAAEFLTESGLKWSQATISQVESGQIQGMSINALLLLSRAYTVPLEEWFKGDSFIFLTKQHRPRMSLRVIRNLMNGGIAE